MGLRADVVEFRRTRAIHVGSNDRLRGQTFQYGLEMAQSEGRTLAERDKNHGVVVGDGRYAEPSADVHIGGICTA
jgi:hypothetical protein